MSSVFSLTAGSSSASPIERLATSFVASVMASAGIRGCRGTRSGRVECRVTRLEKHQKWRTVYMQTTHTFSDTYRQPPDCTRHSSQTKNDEGRCGSDEMRNKEVHVRAIYPGL